MLLSGDIGGTNTRLLISEMSNNAKPTVIASQTYRSADHVSFTKIVQKFLVDQGIAANKIKAACFAAAGPIINGTVKFTNLPWFVDSYRLAKELGLDTVELINDFQANALGVQVLEKEQLYCIQQGKFRDKQPIAVIGAGTGLGVAILAWSEDRYAVMPTEGGHVDFAPVDNDQMELLKYLQRRHHRVSAERIVSGYGLVNIYHFVRDNPLYNEQENQELRHALFNTDDQAALISEYAVRYCDPMALRALDIFIRAYGAVAGNLALSTLCYSGLYIVGGIAPKLRAQMNDGRFIDLFTDKGRMSGLLQDIPVHVVLDGNVGQLGAALYAHRLT